MIESISGKIISKLPHKVVVEQQGIAFEINVPFSTSGKLPPAGENGKVLCHLHWREEGPQLFGFATEAERQLFRLLTKVNKVGPKLAINVMSSTNPDALAMMILSEDLRSLTSLKGVGPKLASRLVVELKEPIMKLGLVSTEAMADNSLSVKTSIPFESEIKEALETLGYTSKEIARSLKAVVSDVSADSTIEEIMEAVLRSFSN